MCVKMMCMLFPNFIIIVITCKKDSVSFNLISNLCHD